MKIMKCVECGTEMVPDLTRRRALAAGKSSLPAHRGRGLCAKDYSVAARAEALLDYDRNTADRDTLLDDLVQLVVERGITDTGKLAEAADMAKGTLTTALWRAAKAGDERAILVRARLPWMHR